MVLQEKVQVLRTLTVLHQVLVESAWDFALTGSGDLLGS